MQLNQNKRLEGPSTRCFEQVGDGTPHCLGNNAVSTDMITKTCLAFAATRFAVIDMQMANLQVVVGIANLAWMFAI